MEETNEHIYNSLKKPITLFTIHWKKPVNIFTIHRRIINVYMIYILHNSITSAEVVDSLFSSPSIFNYCQSSNERIIPFFV